MAIGRPLNLTANVATKNISVIATANQTQFTVTGGYRINEIGVYRNGIRLTDGRDFTASDGSIVTLLSGATVGDVLEFAVFDSFNIANAINSSGDQVLDGTLEATGGFVIGIQSASTTVATAITALNFIGAGNTIVDRGSGSIDISISGSGGGGLGTAIKYADNATDSPFSYIDRFVQVAEDMMLDTTKAGVSTSIIVSVAPNIEINSGVAVTVGAGKTMVIDVLQIGDL